MTDINIRFCQLLLKTVHKAVKTKLAQLAVDHVRLDLLRVNLWKAAWVWRDGRDCWEFHGPDKFYWHGRADNAYEARAKGWQAWLRQFDQDECAAARGLDL